MEEFQVQKPIRVSVAETKKHYDQGNVTILDVVDTVFYDNFSYQIAGALRIRPEDFLEEYTRLQKNKAVYAY